MTLYLHLFNLLSHSTLLPLHPPYYPYLSAIITNLFFLCITLTIPSSTSFYLFIPSFSPCLPSSSSPISSSVSSSSLLFSSSFSSSLLLLLFYFFYLLFPLLLLLLHHLLLLILHHHLLLLFLALPPDFLCTSLASNS